MASATKQALLAALSAAQGECISGQQLAQQLGWLLYPTPSPRDVVRSRMA